MRTLEQIADYVLDDGYHDLAKDIRAHHAEHERLRERVAELERQVLTDREVSDLESIARCMSRNQRFVPGGALEDKLTAIVNRLRPKPVEWVDRGDGSIATLNGYTLMINGLDGYWYWHVTRMRDSPGKGGDELSREAAKAAAVAWAREHQQ